MKKKQKNIDFSISIVSMNNFIYLKKCLESIYKHIKNFNYEIIVVAYFYSNENLDVLRSLFPKVKVIISNKIRGYFENHNLALIQTQGEYCALINDDIELLDNAFYHLINYMKNHIDCGAVCPLLLNKDGTVQLAWRKVLTPVRFIMSQFGPLGKRLSGLWPKINIEKIHKLGDRSIEIPYGTGAFIIIKKNLLEKIGFLDESFFIGPDDIWLGYQLRQANFKIYLVPNVQVIHFGHAVLGKMYPLTLPTEIIDTIKLIKKTNSSILVHILKPLIYLQSSLLLLFRFIIYFITKDFRSKLLMKARLNLFRYGMSVKDGKQLFISIISKEKSMLKRFIGH